VGAGQLTLWQAFENIRSWPTLRKEGGKQTRLLQTLRGGWFWGQTNKRVQRRRVLLKESGPALGGLLKVISSKPSLHRSPEKKKIAVSRRTVVVVEKRPGKEGNDRGSVARRGKKAGSWGTSRGRKSFRQPASSTRTKRECKKGGEDLHEGNPT